mmetsp:Transcript_18159/g.18215  ORF Transcript_18159/g.18215 Transcript_18159/m.18215 type:complete len:99 (+) Transcript_18159:1214-1510(+)
MQEEIDTEEGIDMEVEGIDMEEAEMITLELLQLLSNETVMMIDVEVGEEVLVIDTMTALLLWVDPDTEDLLIEVIMSTVTATPLDQAEVAMECAENEG